MRCGLVGVALPATGQVLRTCWLHQARAWAAQLVRSAGRPTALLACADWAVAAAAAALSPAALLLLMMTGDGCPNRFGRRKADGTVKAGGRGVQGCQRRQGKALAQATALCDIERYATKLRHAEQSGPAAAVRGSSSCRCLPTCLRAPAGARASPSAACPIGLPGAMPPLPSTLSGPKQPSSPPRLMSLHLPPQPE
jgi:hypothetical protein